MTLTTTDWRKSAVYQIYPKSFYSPEGKATGTLRGVTAKLDYLTELGVDYLWLTPVYASPQRDNGYDVSDYYAIDPSYGTMADFDQLIAEANKRQLSVMMDIVVNHCSTDHDVVPARTKSRQPLPRLLHLAGRTNGLGIKIRWTGLVVRRRRR